MTRLVCYLTPTALEQRVEALLLKGSRMSDTFWLISLKSHFLVTSLIVHSACPYPLTTLQFVHNCISDYAFSNSKVREGVKESLMDLAFIFLKAHGTWVIPFYCCRCCCHFHVHIDLFCSKLLFVTYKCLTWPWGPHNQTLAPPSPSHLHALEQEHTVGSFHLKCPASPPPPLSYPIPSSRHSWSSSKGKRLVQQLFISSDFNPPALV